MARTRTLRSARDLYEQSQRERKWADAHIKDWQRSVRTGSFVLRLAEVDGKLLLIYGEIIDRVETERPHYDLDDPMQAAEFDHIERKFGPEWLRSFRYGRWYSPKVVEGEFGSAHIATLTAEITGSEFQAAREQGWPQDFEFAKGAIARRSLS